MKDSIEQEESQDEGDSGEEQDNHMNRTLYGDPIIKINENKNASQASQMSQCSMTSEIDPDEQNSSQVPKNTVTEHFRVDNQAQQKNTREPLPLHETEVIQGVVVLPKIKIKRYFDKVQPKTLKLALTTNTNRDSNPDGFSIHNALKVKGYKEKQKEQKFSAK